MAGAVGRGGVYPPGSSMTGGGRSGTGTGTANSRRTTMMAGGIDLPRGEASSFSLMASGERAILRQGPSAHPPHGLDGIGPMYRLAPRSSPWGGVFCDLPLVCL